VHQGLEESAGGQDDGAGAVLDSAPAANATDPIAFTGRSPEQVVTFIENEVEPIRRRYPMQRAVQCEVDV